MTRPARSRREVLKQGAAYGLAPALAAVPLIGCGKKGDGPLRFWAMGREGEVLPELLSGLAKEQPGLQVRVEQLPFSAAHEKLLTAFAGDAMPDCAQLGNTWIGEMAALHALEPMQPWADGAGLRAADHFEGIWRTNFVDGVLYGLPWYVDTRVLFYRRDLFERAGVHGLPGDWPGFMKALDALMTKGVAHPLLLPLNEVEPLLAMALQQGERLLRDRDCYGNFRSAGFGRALALYLDLFTTGRAPFLTENQIANLWQEFGRGTFAAFISGPWNIGELDRRLPESMKGSWSTAPLPAPAGQGAPGASTAGGSSLVMFRQSKRKHEAMQVFAYLSRPEVQLRFHALTGDLPPRIDTWTAPQLANDTRSAAFRRQLEHVVPSPAVPEWERITQEMQLHAGRAVRYHTPVATVAAELDARVDGFLEKRRFMLAPAA